MNIKFSSYSLTFFAACFLLLLGLSSCQSIYMRMAGIKPLDTLDVALSEQNLETISKSYSGPSKKVLVSDTAFVQYLALMDSIRTKDAYQPIQILYFREGKLRSFHANCYAKPKGLRKLDFAVAGRFDHYIPQTVIEVDQEKWTLEDLNGKLKLGLSPQEMSGEDVIVFLWTSMLLSHSESANQTILQNISEHVKPEAKPLIIYANTDKFFAASQESGLDSTFLRSRLSLWEYQRIVDKQQ